MYGALYFSVLSPVPEIATGINPRFICSLFKITNCSKVVPVLYSLLMYEAQHWQTAVPFVYCSVNNLNVYMMVITYCTCMYLSEYFKRFLHLEELQDNFTTS